MALPLAKIVDAGAAAPEQARPKPGDQLVFATGERTGKTIAPGDLPVGGPQTLAYPADPESGVVRDGSRLNQVLLIRLAPGEFTEETREIIADGVAAYSAVCTHQGCPVSAWKDETKTLFCNCHGSEFDPKDGARVVDGPAPRRLAMLPLTVEDGVLVAAGEFTGRVGFKKG